MTDMATENIYPMKSIMMTITMDMDTVTIVAPDIMMI